VDTLVARLPFLLVLSAVADGTLLARFFTAFFKSLVAAGLPVSAEGIGSIVAAALVSLWAKHRSDRKLEYKVRELMAAHPASAASVPVGPPTKPARKRKKING
jgi:hypothetical protein